MDKFGDSLYYCSEMTIDFEEPLRRLRKPGLESLLHPAGATFYKVTSTYQYISLDQPDVPEKLRSAIASNEIVKAKYIPEAILFTNGTVLK